MQLNTYIKEILADTLTPVSIYLSLRDKYPTSVLLESSEYNSREGHYSYIALSAVASFSLSKGKIRIKTGKEVQEKEIGYSNAKLLEEFESFKSQFIIEKQKYPFCTAGLFGYTSFDIIKYTEREDLSTKINGTNIPELCYRFYKTLLVFDHYNNSLFLISHAYNQEESIVQVNEVEKNIRLSYADFPFTCCSEETADIPDEEFRKLVAKAKDHCKTGDVFQLVLSRRFQIKYTGDDFNVYRALRNINPSPYLFYFDMGDFRLFGSSPEAQLKIKNGEAEIHPIAGTCRRTGNDALDIRKIHELKEDKKENSEHVMLVDLARNDLSKYCNNVEVKDHKEIQLYSHVIHLVSRVKGKIKTSIKEFGILLGTFPAGTLSGAPKFKALQLINKYEGSQREYYGGCIGCISMEGSINHAIMIRTYMSYNNTLYYRAGAGIVIDSGEEDELQEINNKVSALRKAIVNASEINNFEIPNIKGISVDQLETA